MQPAITSREYRLFRQIEERPFIWYERIARLAGNILHVRASKSLAEDLNKAISFTDLRITADNVMSLMVLTIIAFVAIGVISIALGVTLIGSILIIALGFLVAYYFLKYPINLVKVYRIKASSQVVIAILYMVVSMRISPNLERALRFAALNISGELAWDMRKLLWDIQMRKYASANEAIDDYIVKWKFENEEFAEALRLIKESQVQMPERAKVILDEALNVVLEGTRTRMKHYVQDLKMPVMVIHMMGIVLPVLGTIMAPLAAVFLSNIVSPWHFVLGYDIILPIIIVWFINNTLSKRPVTFSEVDISKHPELPKPGSFMLGKSAMPVWPVSLCIAVIMIIPGIIYFATNPDFLIPPIDPKTGEIVGLTDPNPIISLAMSTLIILGIGFGLAVQFILANIQKVKIQNTIGKLESEFELALFQLGNRVAGGVPTEVAIEYAIEDMRDLEIAGLFKQTLQNMRNLGMTFELALFDKKYGSLRYYPSKLIENIMYTIVDTAKKGIRYAAEGMLRIAAYLKSIKETQEYIRELISDTVSSMKFQAYFLTPMITGLIVSMTNIIVQVLVQLGCYLKGLGTGAALGIDFSLMQFGSPSITPSSFQIIVGIYLIEVIVILALFLTKIERGENVSIFRSTAGRMLIIGMIFYILIALAASSMFSDLIANALQGLGILGQCE
jgi:hypothetical protein